LESSQTLAAYRVVMDKERGWSLADYGDNGTKTPVITDHKE